MEKLMDRLAELRRRYAELEQRLSQPETLGSGQYKELSQEYARLKRPVDLYERLQSLERTIAEAQELLESDGDLRALAQEELERAQAERAQLLEELRLLLVPPDPRDDGNAIVEIRAGAGGEESALFAADLFRMYKKYADAHNLHIEVLDAHPTDLGGSSRSSLR
jgi:peptide chain release factor 1